MLCEKCGIREANIKYTEVFNGVKTEHNLCAQCAKEMAFEPFGTDGCVCKPGTERGCGMPDLRHDL